MIYLDHAATTPVRSEAVEVMRRVWAWSAGQAARYAVEAARRDLAQVLEVTPSALRFTSGGTEADNLAVIGYGAALAARLPAGTVPHLIVSAIEHHAVLEAARAVERRGWRVAYLPCDDEGLIDPAAFRRALRPETVLASLMWVNNEVGTIQPLAELATVAREAGVPLHVDAVQAAGHLPMRGLAEQAALFSVSAHKLYGPKGIGLLYAQPGLPQPQWPWREQADPAWAAGFATAWALAEAERPAASPRLKALREALFAELLALDDVWANGHRTLRVDANVNVSVGGVDGEALLLNLDLFGVAASSGSACTAGSIEPSYVLLAMGRAPELAGAAIRLTLGRTTQEDDIHRVGAIFRQVVTRLRRTG